MGHLQDWIFYPRNQYSIIFLFFFLALITTHSRFLPEGRSISKLNENTQIGVYTEKVLFMEGMLIGSRPPRCERRCRGCGHCEAVQVPIAPPRLLKSSTKQSSQHTMMKFYGTPKSIAYSRGDDISNYKPMCWKCKCGDFIFNP